MPKYITKLSRNGDSLQRDVYSSDTITIEDISGPTDTGLLDEQGRRLFRVKPAIGFIPKRFPEGD